MFDIIFDEGYFSIKVKKHSSARDFRIQFAQLVMMEYDNVDDCVKNLDDLDAEFKLLDVSQPRCI